MRRTVIAAALAALALPAAARADTSTITMPGKYFDPSHSTIVAGDTLVFRNNDLVTHDVRIGGVFDSGPIGRFTSWSQQIDQPGGYPFVCTLHAFMGGYLDVVVSTLAAKPDGVLAGEPLRLSGRAPAGTAHVAVERSVSGGAWSADGNGAAPAPDGTFEATVKAVEGASYRVSTPLGVSPAVTPRVIARFDVHLDVVRSRHHIDVRVHTMPKATGFTATLERYSRWRFRWRPARRVKLDSRGRASFRLPAASRSFARVALSRRRRGPALVHSGVVKLRTATAAVDPDAIAPHAPGAHGGGHGGHG